MKAFLMHKDHDLDLDGPLPPWAEVVTQDLELGTVLAAMSAGEQIPAGDRAQGAPVQPD